MPDPACVFCHGPIDVAAFLSRTEGYATLTDSGNAPCPRCGRSLEFRVRSGALELGYTYWAGSMHFEGMETFTVPGLLRHRTGDTVTFSLHGIPIPGPHVP